MDKDSANRGQKQAKLDFAEVQPIFAFPKVKDRYRMMQDCYRSLPASERQYHHRRFLICIATAATITTLDVWLFIRYATRCENLLQACQIVTTRLNMKP